ncbi:hypothetical protein ART_3424 [Arthrobacter sp. PAMC 25486]|uniref:hypothetical protein n=1 Tax=Arthrobacter sp. PAMC 25486 TaxID=1494608 RepID=UPI000535E6DA|nr:hypothetical protein [Arthrobacter sp. PAMC 25486]AIY03023.1 hypothetical protein ART_3424 [Arthrobacter sp. PAMC 25486]
MAKLKTFNYLDLVSAGFKGFEPFDSIRQQQAQGDGGIPQSPGVYLVMRISHEAPTFLAKGFGGQHKHYPKNVPVAELALNWVPGASVLYFGKASQRKNGGGLYDRINEYAVAGRDQKHKHQGGQYIWQMADAKELLVAWKVTPAGTEEQLESSLIAAFAERYGKIPFANRR